MSLDPLFAQDKTVILHAFAAMAALILGCIQLVGPKGTTQHRIIGWSWVILMAIIALSSFNIQGIKQFGRFSLIHGLSVFVLIVLPMGILHARRHNVAGHKKTMIGLFVGALIIAGIFTLIPGRVMYTVVFGHS